MSRGADRRDRLLAALLASLLPAAAVGQPQAPGRDLYVSTTGSDANIGSARRPFRTILRASQAATPGTTVHVAPGVYDGGFTTVASGIAANRVHYRSDRRWGARLVPPAVSDSATAWDNRGNYVTIDGFEVDGSAAREGTPWTEGIYIAGSHDVAENNLVHDIARHAACSNQGGAGIGTDHYYYGIADDVIGNIVHDIGPAKCAYFQGIYVSTSGKIANNLIYNVAAVGIHLWHDATHVTIVNNTVAQNDAGILVGGGDQYHLDGPDDYDYVANNIVVHNRVFGIEEQGKTGAHNRYTNNLVYENGAYEYRLRNGVTAAHPVTGDPRFRQSGADFHLGDGSPAIRGGREDGAPTTDIEGVARPRGIAPDLGAFAYAPSTR